MELGYARVSTTREDLDRQRDALGRYGIGGARIYADTTPGGATIARPGFTELQRRAQLGDTIVVTTLDRFGCTVRECLTVVHELRERGIGIKTLEDPIPIDTTGDSSMADLAAGLLALFARMDRVFMRERAAHAREVARAKGTLPGRPRKLDATQLAAARAALDTGQTVDQVAADFGVSRATLYRNLADAQQEPT